MRRLYRLFWLPLYRRWALRHIRQERLFQYSPMKLIIPPGVFHPGIYFSTPILLDFLQQADFKGKRVLDVGTGSGALGIYAALKGAIATAIDINPQAVETARLNAARNGLKAVEHAPGMIARYSDLFDEVPRQVFDFILINPPFYAIQPENNAEHAFYAGPELAYFDKLFRQMPAYMTDTTRVWMILSEDCDFRIITAWAARYGLELPVVFTRKKWGERLFIVQVCKVG
jgi:release factor glutamine methyltransferase